MQSFDVSINTANLAVAVPTGQRLAAGFTSKSVAPKQTAAVKGRSFSNHQPHTSH